MNVLEALEYEIVSSTRKKLMTRQLKDPRYTWGIVVVAFRAECPWELESDTAIEMRERNSLLITFLMLSMKKRRAQRKRYSKLEVQEFSKCSEEMSIDKKY